MEDMTNTAPGTPGVHSMGLGFEGTLKDMRFIGWVSMIYGILTCLSIAGAIVGVPLIIASHRFIEGINRFDLFRQTGYRKRIAGRILRTGSQFSHP